MIIHFSYFFILDILFSYIHIPFCESKCKYCKFASVWNLQKLKIEKYLNFLLNEINDFDKENIKLKSIYFWWGTPTTIDDKQLLKIINKLNNKFWFSKNIEISLESTPNKITYDNLTKWKRIWINRISIWVQSLNNKTLTEIWRWDKWDIIEALDNIKLLWFNNISIDFIIWLPHVKIWDTKKDIKYILDNYDFIKHISVYMLEDHYYPGNWKNISVDEKLYLNEYNEITNYLVNKWFNKYEVSNFSIPWYECKHNQAYWDHSTVCWFWLWAHSFVNKVRYANSDSFNDYYSKKLSYSELNTDNDIYIEKVMFDFRTIWLDLNMYNDLDNKKIDDFIKQWYLYNENWFIKTTNEWILVLDYLLKEIL